MAPSREVQVSGTAASATPLNGKATVQSPAFAGTCTTLNPDDRAVLGLRNLIFDLCNQNNGGHGGSAIGMAAIGVALYKYVMRYNPGNPDWFDRDRFVLSNGTLILHVHEFNLICLADALLAI